MWQEIIHTGCDDEKDNKMNRVKNHADPACHLARLQI
jgi:hypothetical protein